MMLAGTPAESDEQRKRYSYETKWRVLPGGFSEVNGMKIFEPEEIVVKTNTMSYEDYIYLRRIHLWTTTIFRDHLFKAFRKTIMDLDIDPVEFIQRLDDVSETQTYSKEIVEVVKEFKAKSESELFQSKEEL